MSKREESIIISTAAELMQPGTRRKFLRTLGIGGSIVLLPGVLSACSDKTPVSPPPSPPPPPPPPPVSQGVVLNLSTDVGIFNFAFALEQLEAAFYTAVVGAANFSALFPSAAEQEILIDIRNHEIIHREFFRAALGTSAIQDLALNQATVTASLASRASILATAEQFEDLGVSAYNGAGKQLKDVRNLLVAGKIVSVEARHAAVIRDLRDTTGRRFAGDDVVNAAGLDVKLEPAAVLARVGATNFVTTAISIGTAPTDAATADSPPPATV